jgi:hypothetical protein
LSGGAEAGRQDGVVEVGVGLACWGSVPSLLLFELSKASTYLNEHSVRFSRNHSSHALDSRAELLVPFPTNAILVNIKPFATALLGNAD